MSGLLQNYFVGIFPDTLRIDNMTFFTLRVTKSYPGRSGRLVSAKAVLKPEIVNGR